MTPSKINQNELDELMDKAVRKGVAAAILAAQDAGLVKFPVPLFGLKDAEERIDGIVGMFIEVVKGMDAIRSEERRVGIERVRTGRSGWSPYHKTKIITEKRP